MLLDEPLSNLDSKLREQMRDELKVLIKKMRSTAVHITHDQTEAMALADRIIVMRDGRIEQMGSGRELYRRPVNRFVADFIGVATFLSGEVVEAAPDGKVRVRTSSGLTLLATPSVPEAANGSVSLCLRPENVLLSASGSQEQNVVQGTIASETFLGDHIEYTLDVGGEKIKARSQEDLAIGQPAFAYLPPDTVISLPAAAAIRSGKAA
jgi:iron(III) transport system ATP-binding protein